MDRSALAPTSVPTRSSVDDPAIGWAGAQGVAWATPERNPSNVAGLDASYLTRFGVTRTELNRQMLEGIARDVRVLEVGCSHGGQLNAMAAVGFTDLSGCDINAEAIKLCRWPTRQADGRDLPYGDGEFDLVMTSGTLMQIPPGAKRGFMAECFRVSSNWVYGVEGATEENCVWNFGDLIPPAWTSRYPEGIVAPGWRVARSRWLAPLARRAGYSLSAYLLERE